MNYLNEMPLPEMPQETVSYTAFKIVTSSEVTYLCQEDVEGISIGYDEEEQECLLVVENPAYLHFSLKELLVLMLSESDAKELLHHAGITEIVNCIEVKKPLYPVPCGISREYYEKKIGVLEKYSAYVQDTCIAEYDTGDIEICDDEENNVIWTTEQLSAFLGTLPELTKVKEIQTKNVEKLSLPYTCHTIDDNALQMPNCINLHLRRSNMKIGENNLEDKNIYGIAGSTAEGLANELGLSFTPCFQMNPAPKNVTPWDNWEFSAPPESLYQPETAFTFGSLDLINLPDGECMHLRFMKFDNDDDGYKNAGHFFRLYQDETVEIGILIQFTEGLFGISMQQIDFTIAENDMLFAADFKNASNNKENIMNKIRAVYAILADGKHFGNTLSLNALPENEILETLDEELQDSKSFEEAKSEASNLFNRALGLKDDSEEDGGEEEAETCEIPEIEDNQNYVKYQITSADLYQVRKKMPLFSQENTGFYAKWDTDEEELVIYIDAEPYLSMPLEELLWLALTGSPMPEILPETEKKSAHIAILEYGVNQAFSSMAESGEKTETLAEYILKNTDLISSVNVKKKSNFIYPYQTHFPVPENIAREYSVENNGIIQEYEVYSSDDTCIAEYDTGDVKIRDDGENNVIWTTKQLADFLESLPEVTRIKDVNAENVEKLVLPYTCHTIDDWSFRNTLKELEIHRSNVKIGDDNFHEDMKIYGIAGSTAEQLAKETGCEFIPAFSEKSGEEVKLSKDWNVQTPAESRFEPETENTYASISLINIPESYFNLKFESGQLSEKPDLEELFENDLYLKLYQDDETEIGISAEINSFLWSAFYQIQGIFITGENVCKFTSRISTDEAEEAIKALYQIMKTVKYQNHLFELNALDEVLLSSRLQELEHDFNSDSNDDDDDDDYDSITGDYRNTDGIATEKPEQVTIADDWTVTVPADYLYSTDNDTIGSHRCVIIMKNDETADFDNHFSSSENYSCMNSQTQVCSGDLLWYNNKLKTEFALELFHSAEDKEHNFILKRTSDVAVFCQLQEHDDNNTIFRIQIVTENGLYPMQVFFNESGTLEELGNRMAAVMGSVGTVSVPCTENYIQNFFTLHQEIPIVMPSNSETYRAVQAQQNNKQMMRGILRLGMTYINDSVEYGLYMLENISVSEFELSEKAWNMTDVFRMEEDSYNASFDREGEIRHTFIREIDHFTGFRSFAWCIAEYCHHHTMTPEQIDLQTLLALAQIVESRSFMNYNETYYPAICGVPDMETFYLPDGRNYSEIKQFLEEHDEHIGIADLYQLRNELTELFPCIEKIYHWLNQNHQDKTKPLRGIHSDILYVWCTLAIAANHAFVTTPDVPMNYDFWFEPEKEFSDFEPPVFEG